MIRYAKRQWFDLFLLESFELRFYEKLSKLFNYESNDIEIPRNMEVYLRFYGSIGYAPKIKKWVVGWANGERDNLGNPINYLCYNLATNKESYNLKVGEDVILCYNNSLHASDAPIIEWFCDLMRETDISIKCQILNSRLIPMVSVSNDGVKKQIEEAFKDYHAGKPIVITSGLADEINVLDIIDNRNIEKMQYLTAFYEDLTKRLFNEFGINIRTKDKAAQVNNPELSAFDDLNTINYLSNYQERLDFEKRMNEAGIDFRCIPSPIFAEEPNDEEIEDPEAARELMQESEENAEKEGENDGNEDQKENP